MRPIPHWISSKIRSASWRSQASRAATRSSGSTGCIPLSPCTGSISTAATPSSTGSGPLRGAASKPGTSGANGACLVSWGVADSAPIVRPWKPPSTTTKRPPGFRRRASLMAHSTASAPELQKNTLPPSDSSDSRAASRIAGSV